jgi:two-component system phosphate regulon sensor histidine kinase PhoR
MPAEKLTKKKALKSGSGKKEPSGKADSIDKNSSIDKNNSIDKSNSGAERIGMMLDDGLLICAPDGLILSSNSAAVKLFQGFLTGLQIAELIPAREMQQAFAGKSGKDRRLEFVWQRQTEITQEFRIRVEQLDTERIAILVLDMTLQQNLEKVRRDFVANVSHELRSPLTTLAGFIETMLSTKIAEPETATRFLGIMDEEAQRMKRLIDDLLSLSRVEAMEHIAPQEKVPLDKVVQAVVASLAGRAAQNNMQLEIEDNRPAGQTGAPASLIAGEADEMTEVFNNLVENAIKYGQPGSPVRVLLDQPEAARIKVSIVNLGDGIDGKHLGRLTERFYRVDKARSRQLGGTGLGLAIVKHIVNKHRGQMRVTSEPGGETVFSVTLPLLTRQIL